MRKTLVVAIVLLFVLILPVTMAEAAKGGNKGGNRGNQFVVPEPGTLMAMLASLGAMAGLAIKRLKTKG